MSKVLKFGIIRRATGGSVPRPRGHPSMTHRLKITAALGALAFTLAFPSAAAATTVVAQWDMADTFGDTMTDSSGNNNNGTTYNIVTSGTGYVFDGGTSKVIVPDSPTLNPGAADF